MDEKARVLMRMIWTFAAALLSVIFLAPIEGAAHAGGGSWNFDQSCTRSLSTTVELTKPAAMLMVDRSGSMVNNRTTGYRCWDECVETRCVRRFIFCLEKECVRTKRVCGDTTVTLWDVAVTAINSITQELQEEIDFGIGFFPEGSRNGAYIVHEADGLAYSRINSALRNVTANGGNTPTHDAARVLRNSQTMRGTDRAVRGVLITDGYPVGVNESTVIDELCQARRSGQTISVVGLGGATDTAFNNKMAAAGGTGSCEVDPCVNSSVRKSTCRGSVSAANTTEFENALRAIMGELSCRFPVDTSAFSPGPSPTDPGALLVRLSGDVVPHRASSGGEGWFYPDPNNRREIELTNRYCSKIAEGHADRVETILGCPCSKPQGGRCGVANTPFGVCPVGGWVCDRGYDECKPLSEQQCPVPCPGWKLGELCHTEVEPGSITMAEQQSRVATELSRCSIGRAECVNNIPVCEPRFRAMPEVCNGLDNDCDGVVGNISESWSKDWSQVVGAGYTPDAPACYGQDLCRCRVHVGEHAGEGETLQEEFDDYMRNFVPGDDAGGCICVEN